MINDKDTNDDVILQFWHNIFTKAVYKRVVYFREPVHVLSTVQLSKLTSLLLFQEI